MEWKEVRPGYSICRFNTWLCTRQRYKIENDIPQYIFEGQDDADDRRNNCNIETFTEVELENLILYIDNYYQ